MVVFPNCKINLGLHVIEKRTDGYHNIETVFYPIDLCDVLEITRITRINTNETNYGTSIGFSGININGATENNLCIKAYKLLAKEYKLSLVAIHLHKEIPMRAGLGSGSSDAAYTIKLLNNLFAINLSEDKMEYFASRIGSDCAFFIQNKPVFASGRGDKFSEIKFSLKDYHILIVKPNVDIYTKMAYEVLSKEVLSVKEKGLNTSLRDIVEKPISAWKHELVNDFEKPMFCKYPQLKEIKERLYKEGAIYASMTGSGSAIYGIFEKDSEIYRIKDLEIYKNYFMWKGML